MRTNLFALGALILVGCTYVTSDDARLGTVSSKVTGSFAVVSGVSGTVTTLATYAGGGAHPGVNSVDIGASGGSAVWHQLDYLPSDVAGGWVRVYASIEAGFCSQWPSTSPYYNGNKLVAVTYFYGTDGAYRGWHRSAYQHVVPSGGDRWVKWNNASATKSAWGAPDAVLGNGTSGGVYMGTVFSVPAPIANGPGGGLCTDGSHLHQEGDGARNAGMFVGKGMTARYNDVHYFGFAGGDPPIGPAPSAPAFDVPVPTPSAPGPAPTSDPEPSSSDSAAPTDPSAARPRHGARGSGSAPARPADPAIAPPAEPSDSPASAPATEVAGCTVAHAPSFGCAAFGLAAIASLAAWARRRARAPRGGEDMLRARAS